MNEECPICLDKINRKEKQVDLGCPHNICVDCLLSVNTFVCPLCRHDFENSINEDVKTIITNNKEKNHIKESIKGTIQGAKLFLIDKIRRGMRVECLPPKIFCRVEDQNIVGSVMNQITEYSLDEDFLVKDSPETIIVVSYKGQTLEESLGDC